MNGYINLYNTLSLLSSSLNNGNIITFNNNANSYVIQQIDSTGQNFLRIGRTGFNDIKIDSTGVNILNNLTIGGSLTLTGSITNNAINIGNLNISYGLKRYTATNNCIQFDLAGNNNLFFFWDGVEIENNLTINGNLISNSVSNFYSGINLNNSSFQSTNKIYFNNNTNGFYITHTDDNSKNQLSIGRVTAGIGYYDFLISGIDGTTTIANNTILNGICNLNQSLILPIINSSYSIWFGVASSINNVMRIFASSTSAYVDYYNTLIFRYYSAKDNSTGQKTVMTLTQNGITLNGNLDCYYTSGIHCFSANGYTLNYVNIPSTYSNGIGNIIGSQLIFKPTSQVSMVSTTYNQIMSLTIGTSATSTQIPFGIWNLKIEICFWTSNTSNTISFNDYLYYGISSITGSAPNWNLDIYYYKVFETRTLPTNFSSTYGLDMCLKYVGNVVINTNECQTNNLYLSAYCGYTGGTGIYVTNQGLSSTKLTFTRI